MFKELNIKKKIYLFTFFVLLITFISTLFIMYMQQQDRLADIKNKDFSKIRESFDKNIQIHLEKHYLNLADSLLSEEVKSAIYKKDRIKLEELIKDKYISLKVSDEYIRQIHFHLPDGLTLYRAHKPQSYNDDIAALRPMAKKIHQVRKVLTGFEAGKNGLSFRVFSPVFYKGAYAGALEIGISPTKLLDIMTYFNNIQGLIYIEKSPYQKSAKEIQKTNIKDMEILKKLPENYDFEHDLLVEYKGKKIVVYKFDIKDFSGKKIGKFLFINDLSNEYRYFSSQLVQLVVIFTLSFVLLFIVINIGFSRMINSLNLSNEELGKNKLFTDSVLNNLAHAVIATDQKGVITLFNKKAQELLGYKEEDVVGKQSPVIFHKKDEMRRKAKLYSKMYGRDIKADMGVFTIKTDLGLENYDEWTYVDINGNEFPVSSHITSLEDINGNKNGYLGIFEDITYKKIMAKILEEQKNELQTIFDTNKDGIAITDLDTNFLLFNDAYLNMTGFTKEELLKKSCLELSSDKEEWFDIIKKVKKEGFVENFEKTCLVKEKKIKVNISISLMPDKQRLLLSVKDITEAKYKEGLIKSYVELIDKNIITSTTNLKGEITQVSEAFCRISGYEKDELLGKSHSIVKHPDMPATLYKELWSTITRDRVWTGELKNKKKDGGYYWVNATITPIYNEEGEKIGYTAIRQDITDKKMVEQISITDGLTNIFNRRHFNDVMPDIINSAKREDEILCFLIMDIDYFKQYNDTYGHQMGDEVLIKVAWVLKKSLKRAGDFCFRLGGEEFGIVFKGKNMEESISFSEMIRKNIEDLQIEHLKNDASKYVTISAGMVCKKASGINSADEIYKDADLLLYKAKESGRNRVCTR